MQITRPRIRRTRRAWLLGLVLCVGCGMGSLFKGRSPHLIPVSVNYLPYLVKGNRPHFLPAGILVLRPLDRRPPYPLKYGGALPVSQDKTAILGIWGLNSKEGVVRVNSYQLGAQRRMKAGVPHDPDIPRGIFLLSDLSRLVQDALASHFQEAGFRVEKVHAVSPQELRSPSEPAPYALGCVIEEFSLVSLERRHEVRIDLPLNSHAIYLPIRGPTRANVTLALTLYRWPSGHVLWEGKVANSVDDPPLQESEFLYASPGEVMSMALSRTVGSILIAQSLQDVLLTR